ncbi:TlpA family protein disulfide reductase [Dactylosporangium sp. NPDC048998]|uniref:TlpA family protein disulfide reductase n=1 Tax=Dactylosporangium sp. NPDC048998 TaxID=3363976 RepID=UPI003722C1D9
MPYLVSVVVLVGAVGLLNLVLTYGVIRRLREHTALLAGPPAGGGSPWPEVGKKVGAFTATTTTGRPLSTADLPEGAAVGFFRTGCQPCTERMPRFAEYAQAHDAPERFVAVLVGEPEELAEEIRLLTPLAQVVLTQRDSDVLKAFDVSGFPTLVRLGAGQVIAASGLETSTLDAAQPALAS